MQNFTVISPAGGARVVQNENHTFLVGQPPEVLKGLMSKDINQFDSLVLLDSHELDGSLMNNLEFPLYFFLFFSNGLAENKKLNLVGEQTALDRMMQLLQYTLFGPNTQQLEAWSADQDMAKEWLAVSAYLALKKQNGDPLTLDDFFNLIAFKDDKAQVGNITINHSGHDKFTFYSDKKKSIEVDLSEDKEVNPAYSVPMDYVPGGLVKLGLEILGGASGFSQNEPCTGIALCHNGDYLLIDSIPFLDQHLYARGISKNQISAVFLTHLHDDHCSMFPLMQMPHKVDIITTKEIYEMALEKLSCQLAWETEIIGEFFNFVAIQPNQTINYFGIDITAHNTVHSIPTIGATFSATHKNITKSICVVGDNHSMTAINDMVDKGIVSENTQNKLQQIFTEPYDLLVADGGAGAIHGDPVDALESKSDRIVFVHVDKLPDTLLTTFSLASSGKRYTLFDGNSAIYTAQISHYLTQWLGYDFPSRWLRCLLSEQEILKYNRDDVVMVQGAPTKGCVYLVLSGYCDVLHQTKDDRILVAQLQAGDIIGEMAAMTGHGTRNASVVARTPMTVCALQESTFAHFIQQSNVSNHFLQRWKLRPLLKMISHYKTLNSLVHERVCQMSHILELKKGEKQWFNADCYSVLISGSAFSVDTGGKQQPIQINDEFGYFAIKESKICEVTAKSDCCFIEINSDQYDELIASVPQFNYQLRKRLES